MKVFDGSWKSFAVRTVVFCAAVFGTMRLATARDGVAGGPARSSVTAAGTLTGVTGTASVRFRFFDARTGGTPLCESSRPVEAGPFSVEVPLEGTGTSGPRCMTMFDGADVFVEVAVNGTTIGERASINPVPYAHFASVAGVARQYETPDCPLGYEHVADTTFSICQRRRADDGQPIDFVIRVGTGPAAFWIDRYEATVYAEADRGPELGRSDAMEYGTTFPPNGQWVTPRYVLSIALPSGRTPSRFITWFQASEACAASGKRLPTGEEWLRAANGTNDSSPGCNISSGAPRNPGGGTGCRSRWGAEDMIGNLWEWTEDWYAGAVENTAITQINLDSMGRVTGTGTVGPREAIYTWPTMPGHDYFGDGTSQIGGQVSNGFVQTTGLPSAVIRGGDYQGGTRAGRFALHMGLAPSAAGGNIGFRCVIPR